MFGAALYIHIPFCEKRCNYCHFYTVAGVNNRIPDYIRALKTEIALRADEPFWNKQRFASIFFGGGTPSLLSPEQIADIIEACYSHFDFSPTVEITLEADPATVDERRLHGYRIFGINRLSLGLQSFHDDELVLLERTHTTEQAIATAVSARYAGFENVSFDFMFALPGHKLKKWRETLRTAMELQPNHISTYNLTVETGTALDVAIRKGRIRPLTEKHERKFFELTIDFMQQHGYRHYEISNFAQPGYEAQHNLRYWVGQPYLGLGASAHSYDGAHRFWNLANLRKYLEAISKDQLPEENREQLTLEQRMFEYTFLGLRQTSGVDLEKFALVFGKSFDEVYNGEVSEMQSHGFLQREGSRLRLTTEGLFLCDEICARLNSAQNTPVKIANPNDTTVSATTAIANI